MQLSNIFVCSENKKRLLKESKDFDTIKKFELRRMKEVNGNKRVAYHCTPEKALLSVFEEHNHSMDMILKNLNNFLDTKRRDFPRFYFVSNE
jgi:dynein heavy chain